MLVKVAWKSLLDRKLTAALTILAIAISVFVLLGVEHIRHETKSSFSNTVSGVDIIVGARTGQVNLLLYSVFRIGNATNNISWKSYQTMQSNPLVAWSIPISLGDSHKGYRVMGTDQSYFKHFKYAQQTSLLFAQGKAFADIYEVAIGSEVAKKLNYVIGDKITLSHGVGKISFSHHDEFPFTIVGILEPTGTPVDQTLHVSLEGLEAIHEGWESGVKLPSRSGSFASRKPSSAKVDSKTSNSLQPKSITAVMIGLRSKVATFRFQRAVNNYRKEPLLAILPGVALAELWQMMGIMEKVLSLISILVLGASLLGMSTMLLASMQERKKELAVLRSIGAHSIFIMGLIQMEALFIALMGTLLGIFLLTISLLTLQPYISENYGLFIGLNFLNNQSLIFLGIIFLSATLLALIPGIVAYRYSLGKSLTRF